MKKQILYIFVLLFTLGIFLTTYKGVNGDSSTTFYVDSINGDDSFIGTEESKAFKTLNKAYEMIDSNTIIVLVNNYEYNGETLKEHNFNVTFKAKNKDIILNVSSDLVLSSNTTFETITLNNNSTTSLKLYASNFQLTIVESTTVTGNNNVYFTVVGSKNIASIGDVNIKIHNGNFKSVYGTYDQDLKGNVNILITKGLIESVVSASETGNVTGDTFICLNASNKDDIILSTNVVYNGIPGIFGGSCKGRVDGNTNVYLKGKTKITTNVFGGGRASSQVVTKKASVYVSDEVIFTGGAMLFGGGRSGSVGSTYLEIDGTNVVFETSNNHVFGGGWYDTIGDSTKLLNNKSSEVVINTLIKGNVTSAGNMYLGGGFGQFLIKSGAVINYSKVYGSANVQVGDENSKITVNQIAGGGRVCEIYGNVFLEVKGLVTTTNMFTGSTGYVNSTYGLQNYAKVYGDLSFTSSSTKEIKIATLRNGNYQTVFGKTVFDLGINTTITKVVSGGGGGTEANGAYTSDVDLIINGANIERVTPGGVNSTVFGNIKVIFKGGEVRDLFLTSSAKASSLKYFVDLSSGLDFTLKIQNLNMIFESFIGGTSRFISAKGSSFECKEFSGNTYWSIIDPLGSCTFKAPLSTLENQVIYVKYQEDYPSFDYAYQKTNEFVFFGVVRKMKVTFSGLDLENASLTLYKGYDLSGEVQKSNDGVYDLDLGVYVYALRNTNKAKMYVEYNHLLYLDNELYESFDGEIFNIDAFEGFRTNEGYIDNDPILILNDQLLNTVRGTSDLPNFTTNQNELGYYTTPVLEDLRSGIIRQQYTSQDEMKKYLEELQKNSIYSKYFHLYTIGTTEQSNREIYMVIFTTTNVDGLSYIEALEKVSKEDEENKKVRVMHTSQVHGSEHADAEGELAILYQLAHGTYCDNTTSNFSSVDELLQKASFVIIPRSNVDGAYEVLRYTQQHQIDGNRDKLMLQASESALVNKIYYAYMADVVISGHELVGDAVYENGYAREDAQIGSTVFNLVGNEISSYIESQVMPYAFDSLRKQNLLANPYNCNANSLKEPSFFSLTGCANFLIEVRGTGLGTGYYERRVYAYVEACKAVCDKIIMDGTNFTYDESLANKYYQSDVTSDAYFDLTNSKSFLQMVKDRRALLLDGNVDLIIESKKGGLNTYVDLLDSNGLGTSGRFYFDGTISNQSTIRSYKYYDTVVSKRDLPDGYFIDASVFNQKSSIFINHTTIKEIFDNQQIEYYFIPTLNNSIEVSQIKALTFDTHPYNLASTGKFKSNIKIIETTCEEKVNTSFSEGVYFIPTKQIRCLVVAHLLEQDILNNLYNEESLLNNQKTALQASLYSGGWVDVDENNMLPIYRYYGDASKIINLENDIKLYEKVDNNYLLKDYFEVPFGNQFDVSNLYYYQNGEYKNVDSSMFNKEFTNNLGIFNLELTLDNVTYYVGKLNVVKEDKINENIIYVSDYGNDELDGLKDVSAVKTLFKAYELLLNNKLDGPSYIVLINDVTWSHRSLTLPIHDKEIIYTSSISGNTYNDGKLILTHNINFFGPTTIENTLIYNGVPSTSRLIIANGHKLTLGNNLEVVSLGGYYPTVVGGFERENGQCNVDLTIYSGTYRSVYGGSYRGDVVGDINVTIYGGEYTYLLYGGSYQDLNDTNKAIIDGNIKVNIYGGIFNCNVYFGSNHGSILKDVTAYVYGGTFNKNVGLKCNDGNILGIKTLYVRNSMNLTLTNQSDTNVFDLNEIEIKNINALIENIGDVDLSDYEALLKLNKLVSSLNYETEEVNKVKDKLNKLIDEYNQIVTKMNEDVNSSINYFNLIVKYSYFIFTLLAGYILIRRFRYFK